MFGFLFLLLRNSAWTHYCDPGENWFPGAWTSYTFLILVSKPRLLAWSEVLETISHDIITKCTQKFKIPFLNITKAPIKPGCSLHTHARKCRGRSPNKIDKAELNCLTKTFAAGQGKLQTALEVKHFWFSKAIFPINYPMLPERRLLTRKLNVLKCKGKTSRLACVTMRVFVEANLRLLVMGPGETSILLCVSTLPGQSLNM